MGSSSLSRATTQSGSMTNETKVHSTSGRVFMRAAQPCKMTEAPSHECDRLAATLSAFPPPLGIRNQTTLACPRLLCFIFQPFNIGRGIRLIAATGLAGRPLNCKAPILSGPLDPRTGGFWPDV